MFLHLHTNTTQKGEDKKAYLTKKQRQNTSIGRQKEHIKQRLSNATISKRKIKEAKWRNKGIQSSKRCEFNIDEYS